MKTIKSIYLIVFLLVTGAVFAENKKKPPEVGRFFAAMRGYCLRSRTNQAFPGGEGVAERRRMRDCIQLA